MNFSLDKAGERCGVVFFVPASDSLTGKRLIVKEREHQARASLANQYCIWPDFSVVTNGSSINEESHMFLLI